MSRICGECGWDIPDDMDFCPRCGSRATIEVGGQDGSAMMCPQCGTPFTPGDSYCGKCGAQLSRVVPMAVRARMRKHANLALMVALIAGFFNVFGLGHLILRSYSRGVMFLVLSVVIWYLNGWSLFGSDFVMVMLTVLVYFYQAIDVTRVAMTPEDR